MSLAQFNPTLPTVYVSGDWTVAAVVMADIANQWGFDFGAVNTYTIDLWEGPNDGDDVAQLVVTAGVPALTAFASAPAIGSFAFVMDMFWA